MEQVKPKKVSAYYTGLSSEESRKKSDALIKVNGVEVTVTEYFQDPEKYNKIKMDPDYVKQIEEQHRKNLETKARLQVDPSSVKSIL